LTKNHFEQLLNKREASMQDEQNRSPESPELEAEQTTAAESAEPTAEASSDDMPPEPGPEELGRLLEDARAKADEHWDQLLRTQAELENLKRRHERDLENAHKYALDKFVAEIVGVWDSLELGQQAAQDEAADVAKLREGTELTLQQLTSVMAKFGVEQINPEGETFNPEFHQAMSMQPRDDVPANTVVMVIQRGYTLNGRLVRPALVMVSQAG
jgi:molecular chaperone GrpE